MRAPGMLSLGLWGSGIAILSLVHIASVSSNFRITAGLHRWLMTYAEGFHRRGLVGTIFQFFSGDITRKAKIALASSISAIGLYVWWALSFALLLYAMRSMHIASNATSTPPSNASQIGRQARFAVWGFAAFAFINPMWTTRTYDNGYFD